MRVKFDSLTYRTAYCDPASSKTQLKVIRARQAIVCVAVDDYQRIFVLHAWAGRLPVDKFYDKILEVNERFHPKAFGIEANAMQSFVGEAVALEARRRNVRLPFVPVNQPTKVDKDFRIRTLLQPVVGWGRLFTGPGHTELVKEILAFPTSPLKDLVDALASAIALLPARSMRTQTQATQNALAKYLRDTGAPPSYIQQRLAEVAAGARPTMPTIGTLDSRANTLYTQQ